MESKKVVRARQEYELADERMEKIFNEALAEVERLQREWIGMKSEIQLCHPKIERLEVAVKKLTAEKSERIIEANTWMGHCLRLRDALEQAKRHFDEFKYEDARFVIEEALKGGV